MLPQEIIRKKRDGQKLEKSEIEEFIFGVPKGTVSEGQVASFCMSVFFNGMDMDERVALTLAMANSGTVVDWSNVELDGPVLDKHSTGGIGDKVSLILAPVIAVCGGYVPMISGRGLGHTGGTLDKMDSIPGYVSQPDLDKLKEVTKKIGCAIIGATSDIAPADKRIYSIRDVTATVESLDLITASILSKKLSAGLDGLVMDVKHGTGAFMQDYDDAKALAESIVSVANGAGMKTTALLTDMNEVLGKTAGNAVEVMEVVEFLKGNNVDERLYEVNLGLCSELLITGGLAKDYDDAKVKIDYALESGKALEKFAEMITELGGAPDFTENPEKYLRQANVIRDVYHSDEGYVSEIDAREVGIGIIELGGGRIKPEDEIDHSVGLSNIASIGDKLNSKTPIATIHAKSEQDADNMEKRLYSIFKLSDNKPKPKKTINQKISY